MYSGIMNEPRFTWDADKARENCRKHGVPFEEAVLAFRDDDGIRIFDTEHSAREDRFVLIGLSDRGRLLVVSHCYRQFDREIRIISARKATPNETQQYTRREL
jgi:uncharacterized protein